MAEIFVIPCQIERGAFTQERTFHIPLSESIVFEGEREGELIGTAHADYLRTQDNKPLDDDTPQYGTIIGGYVLGRSIRQLPGRAVLVEVPSADVIHVAQDALIPADSGG